MSKSVEQAYQKIRDGILSGKFHPGQRLVEADLVRFCGVSRTPIRAAINQLAAEEFVSTARNQGAHVKNWAYQDIDELFELRSILEGHAAARAATHITDEQLQSLADAIAEMEKVIEKSGASKSPTSLVRLNKEFLRLNAIVHRTIWDASCNNRLVAILSRLVEQSLQVRTVHSFTPTRLGESHEHHRELLRALTKGDAVWAEAIMRSHICAARDTLLLDSGDHTDHASLG